MWAAPPAPGGPRVAVVIWRDPWMVVGGDTFADDMLARLGCVNAFHDSDDRYPTVTAEMLDAMGLDLVLLPDEPYVFTESDGPEAFATTPTALISGRTADLVRTVTGTGPLDSRGEHPEPVTVPHPRSRRRGTRCAAWASRCGRCAGGGRPHRRRRPGPAPSRRRSPGAWSHRLDCRQHQAQWAAHSRDPIWKIATAATHATRQLHRHPEDRPAHADLATLRGQVATQGV